MWRGVRVVEGARLESVCGVKSTQGSNPCLSAIKRGVFMRQTLLLLIVTLLIMANSACSKKIITAEVTNKSSLGKEITYYYNGKEIAKRLCNMYDDCSGSNIPDGTIKFNDSETHTSYEGNYVNNRRMGLFSYYENGKLKTEANYKSDRLDGVGKVYYENGKVSTETNYKDGKHDGLMRTYYEDGTLKEEMGYKNDKLNGVMLSYYRNGKIEVEKTLTNGQLNGPSKHYDEDGNLEEELSFVNGVTEGTRRMFYKNGKIKEENIYKHGKKISEQIFDE
jgi:antitoxin component YwqK of YwqJK toxin-antitoxin module